MLALGIGLGARLVKTGGRGTYMGLIILWAFPFLLLLWQVGRRDAGSRARSQGSRVRGLPDQAFGCGGLVALPG